MQNNSIKQLFYDLETKLHRPDIRRSAEEVAKLLADDFIEIGSAGKAYTKEQIIEELAAEDSISIEVKDFKIRVLSPDIVLVTYRANISTSDNNSTRLSWRSSIWKFNGVSWQIVFHQGTIIL